LAIRHQKSTPSPPSFVLYGVEATGKTLTLRALLEESGNAFSWLPCHECITARHLTERIAATVRNSLDFDEELVRLPRSQDVSTLAVFLQVTLGKRKEAKHFLVRVGGEGGIAG